MGTMQDMWLKWKMLRLPWRKRFLIGQDLAGNTYWEFKDALNHNRYRRIVKYSGKTHHSEVQVSPQWHQWLRQTRIAPPTLQEQAGDIVRQAQLKQNARLADERWASKAKYIESPKQAADATASQRPQSDISGIADDKTIPDDGTKGQETGVNPGSDWQPAAWVPGGGKR